MYNMPVYKYLYQRLTLSAIFPSLSLCLIKHVLCTISEKVYTQWMKTLQINPFTTITCVTCSLGQRENSLAALLPKDVKYSPLSCPKMSNTPLSSSKMSNTPLSYPKLLNSPSPLSSSPKMLNSPSPPSFSPVLFKDVKYSPVDTPSVLPPLP